MDSESPLPLAGQCALVTGGARRIGATLVQELHAAGANVVIHCRTSADDAAQLAAACNARRSDSAIVATADLRDLTALPALVAKAVSMFGRLDILVNNASTFYPTPVGSITADAFDDLIGTNLRAPLFLAQAAAPHLRRYQGLILNITDIHASRPLKGHPTYCAAKAGLAMLTQSLARELAPQVRVNAIAPGPVLWPDAEMDERVQTQILERTALKRLGSPGDVARAALYFATAAPYVTGQVLAVDGGRSVGGY